jgi:hypothetical protein
MERVVTGTAGVPGFTIAMAGPRSLLLTRRFIPGYAIFLAAVGFLLFLVGLLALLIKETETLSVSIAGASDGSATRVSISGVIDQQMSLRINSVLVSLTPAKPSSHPTSDDQNSVERPATLWQQPSPELALPISQQRSPGGWSGQSPGLAHAPTRVVKLGVDIKTSKAVGQLGVVVTVVRPNSLAMSLGLQAGDIITRIGGRQVFTDRDLMQALGSVADGPSVRIEWARNGRANAIDVALD